jgi:hypothetical protein
MVSRTVFIVSGLLAWAVAIGFGLNPTVRIRGPVAPPAGSNLNVLQDYEAVNVTGAGASLGFAVGGGLCILAAGLPGTGERRPAGADRAEPPAAADRGRV